MKAGKPEPMTEEELAALIDQEMSASVGYHAGTMAEERQRAMEYYLGKPFGNEQEGRSQFVSRDVADTIEWIMPNLLKIFTAADDVVKCEPQGPEDQGLADQASDYLNYVFNRQNKGFVTLYTWFKDALLQKNGFVKVYWDETTKRRVEEYENMSMEELTKLVMELEKGGAKVEVLEHEQEEEGISVKLSITREECKVCIDPLPPEEVFYAKRSDWDLQKCRFVAHRTRKTQSELREMGIDTEGLEDGDDIEYELERQVRFNDEEWYDGENGDEATRYFTVTEAYPLVDFDGDGVAERRIVTVIGKKVVYNEEIDRVPIVSITPILMPHKLSGMSVADLVMDLQLLKSTLLRQILDNMYLTNSPRMAVLDGMVNIDDLITVRPGGVVRMKTFDAAKPMQIPFFGAPAFNMLEYIDTIRENRTGVTRYNQGIDANSLNKTATGINNIMSAAQQRIELIARVFAETGVKELFWSILELVTKHERKSKIVRLRNEWVQVDPMLWADKFDLTVTVGLGTGNKDQLLQGAQLIGMFQEKIASLGGMGRIVTEANVFNLAREVADAVFPKKADQFFTDPSKLPPPEEKPDPELEFKKEKLQTDDKTKRDLAAVELLKTTLGPVATPPQAPQIPQGPVNSPMPEGKAAPKEQPAVDMKPVMQAIAQMNKGMQLIVAQQQKTDQALQAMQMQMAQPQVPQQPPVVNVMVPDRPRVKSLKKNPDGSVTPEYDDPPKSEE